MKKLFFALSTSLTLCQAVIAQDVHSTQYFNFPLSLNPALTGLVEEDIRGAATYRSQWSSISAKPYVTSGASADIACLKGKLPEGDALGLGLLTMYDKAGTGALSNTTVALSLAYHKAFGMDKQHTISIGMQGTYVQKSIQFAQLLFSDEIDPNTATIVYSTQETPNNTSFSYADVNTGIMYNGRLNERTTVCVGYSYYHLTQPVETFLGGAYKIHPRQTAYSSASFELEETVVLYTSLLFQLQGPATEVVGGSALGFILNPAKGQDINESTIIYLGGWYRYLDAAIPYIGIQFAKMQLGISYDINISGLYPATKGAGAYEFTFVYKGSIDHTKAPDLKLNCPRF